MISCSYTRPSSAQTAKASTIGVIFSHLSRYVKIPDKIRAHTKWMYLNIQKMAYVFLFMLKKTFSLNDLLKNFIID